MARKDAQAPPARRSRPAELFAARAGVHESGNGSLRMDWQGDSNILVIRIDGYLSRRGALRLERLVEEETRGCRLVLVDLAGCSLANACALTVVSRLQETLAESGRDLSVCGARPALEKVLRIMGVDGHVAVFPDRDTAVAALRRRHRAKPGLSPEQR